MGEPAEASKTPSIILDMLADLTQDTVVVLGKEKIKLQQEDELMAANKEWSATRPSTRIGASCWQSRRRRSRRARGKVPRPRFPRVPKNLRLIPWFPRARRRVNPPRRRCQNFRKARGRRGRCSSLCSGK